FTISKKSVTSLLTIDDPDDTWDTRLAAVNEVSLLNTAGDFDLKFDLADNKTGAITSENEKFETYESTPEEDAFTDEDAHVWRAFINNQTMLNKENEIRPMIITSFIFEIEGFNFEQRKFAGDSVYLNLTAGGVQEFVIGSIMTNNPIVDWNTPTEGPPTFNSVWFLNDFWAERVDGLAELSGRSNLFLGKSSEGDITSGKIDNLITKIEVWANQETGDFRVSNGNVFYGVVGIPVYDVYEVQLEGQYRFFLFLQAFVSLGFVVGILGLLVVAFRSVAERTREIGMLRALGFRRVDVVISVVLELVVMGLIGLIIGFINGSILGYALTDINSGGDASFLIPWPLLGFYAALTLGSALLASIFPAIKAARIPPSDALRYTG
ncbi:MAG: ABC transporter permease, partial [Candidatus Kariarchaeaceae archaeon]